MHDVTEHPERERLIDVMVLALTDGRALLEEQRRYVAGRYLDNLLALLRPEVASPPEGREPGPVSRPAPDGGTFTLLLDGTLVIGGPFLDPRSVPVKGFTIGPLGMAIIREMLCAPAAPVDRGLVERIRAEAGKWVRFPDIGTGWSRLTYEDFGVCNDLVALLREAAIALERAPEPRAGEVTS